MTVRPYVVTYSYRWNEHADAPVEKEQETVRAYDAADAVTQAKVLLAWRVGLQLLEVRPLEEVANHAALIKQVLRDVVGLRLK